MKRFVHIHTIFALLLVSILAMATYSCMPEEKSETIVICPDTGHPFDGVWSIDDNKGKKDTVIIYSKYMQSVALPYNEMLTRLFPNSKIEDVTGSSDDGKFVYTVTLPSESSTLFSLQPNTWHIQARIDNEDHKVAVSFASIDNNSDLSWATLSNSGLLTIILRPTAYSIDGGKDQPVTMKLAFTAKR